MHTFPKHLLFALSLFFLSFAKLQAAPDAPIYDYFPSSKCVCLARVVRFDKSEITFAVTEELRGKPTGNLKLTADGVPYSFPVGTEWLLVSYEPEQHGQYKNDVGWQPEGGFDGWFPVQINRIDGKMYIKEWTLPSDNVVLNTPPNRFKGLTLDHLKRLLQDRPYKG